MNHTLCRLLVVCWVFAGGFGLRADPLPEDVASKIPAWIEEAEKRNGRDVAANARHLAWRVGWVMSRGDKLDPEALANATRQIQHIVFERYQQSVAPDILHQTVVEQGFDAMIVRRLKQDKFKDMTDSMKRAYVITWGGKELPTALASGMDTDLASFVAAPVVRRVLDLRKLPSDKLPGLIQANQDLLRKSLSAKQYAIFLASAPRAGQSYADKGKIAFEAALDAGGTEAEAKQAAIRAMTLYARRIADADPTEYFTGLHVQEIVDAAAEYTDDFDLLERVGREAVHYGGGTPQDLDRTLNHVRRLAGRLEYGPLPEDNGDLRLLRDTLNRLDSEMDVFDAASTAKMDPRVAEKILDHLTELEARFGSRTELTHGGAWERESQAQPETLMGCMKAYRYLYVQTLDQLTKNGLETDEQIQWMKDLLVLQGTLMEINQAMLELASFTEFWNGGAVKWLDEVGKLGENPDLPGINRAIEGLSKLDKAISYGKSPIKMVERIDSIDWDSPQAANIADAQGMELKDLISLTKQTAKTVHEQRRDMRKYLRELQADMRKMEKIIREEPTSRFAKDVWKQQMARNNSLSAFKKAVKSKNVLKTINYLLVPWAKADHAGRIQELRDMQKLAKQDQKHFYQVRENWSQLKLRAEEAAALADRIQVSRQRLIALYRSKTYRSYPFVAGPAPVVNAPASPGGTAKVPHTIGAALAPTQTRCAKSSRPSAPWSPPPAVSAITARLCQLLKKRRNKVPGLNPPIKSVAYGF